MRRESTVLRLFLSRPSAIMFALAAIEQLTLDPKLPHLNTSIAIRLKRARPGNCASVHQAG
jgi:hypothetical protein